MCKQSESTGINSITLISIVSKIKISSVSVQEGWSTSRGISAMQLYRNGNIASSSIPKAIGWHDLAYFNKISFRNTPTNAAPLKRGFCHLGCHEETKNAKRLQPAFQRVGRSSSMMAFGSRSMHEQSGGLKTLLPKDLRILLEDDSADVQFIDVREEWEHETANLPKFDLLPLSRYSQWAPTIEERYDKNKRTVCLCHHGVRSMQMANFLASKSFEEIYNVEGGIHAYSLEADKNVPQY